MKLNEIVREFKAKAEQLRKNDAATVPLVIEQARLMAELRTKARKNWEKTSKERLGIDPRVARRYLKIGEAWADTDRTPGSDTLARLPSDLQKLEAICQLPLDQIDSLSRQVNLRKLERADLIAKVKTLAGKATEQPSASDPVLAIFNRWDGFVSKLTKDVRQLDGAGQERFAEEVDDLVQQMREEMDKALKPPSEDGDEEAEDEENEEAEQSDKEENWTDGEEAPEMAEPHQPDNEEKPAQQAPASKGGRPAKK